MVFARVFLRRGAWLGRLFLCVFALVGRVKGLRYCAALAVRSVCALVARRDTSCTCMVYMLVCR